VQDVIVCCYHDLKIFSSDDDADAADDDDIQKHLVSIPDSNFVNQQHPVK